MSRASELLEKINEMENKTRKGSELEDFEVQDGSLNLYWKGEKAPGAGIARSDKKPEELFKALKKSKKIVMDIYGDIKSY